MTKTKLNPGLGGGIGEKRLSLPGLEILGQTLGQHGRKPKVWPGWKLGDIQKPAAKWKENPYVILINENPSTCFLDDEY